jgi:hypothetical protein
MKLFGNLVAVVVIRQQGLRKLVRGDGSMGEIVTGPEGLSPQWSGNP